MRFWIALAAMFCAGNAVAETYGYLRVTVQRANSEHRTNIEVRLNGKNFATFSHSLSAPMVKQIAASYMSKGTSTPLSSDYGGLQKGCEFDFKIEYSIDQGTWIDLGTYHAPSVNLNSAIPIGVCDGELCSANPAIKKRLEEIAEQRWKEAGEAIKKWLEDSMGRQARELEAERERLESERINEPDNAQFDERAAQIGDELSLAETSAADAGIVDDPRQYLDQRIAEAVAAGSTQTLLMELATEESFYKACADGAAAVQSYCAQYGGFGWIVATADAMAVAMAADPEAATTALVSRMNPLAAANLEGKLAAIAEARFRVQETLEAKRASEMRDSLTQAARFGAIFTPLNDVLDLCEAISGKEFCVSGGRDLVPSQRFVAVVGIIAGNRLLWERMTDDVRRAIYGGFSDPESVAALANKIAESSTDLSPKGVSHVLFGEFSRGKAAVTQIRSGMHTEDAVKSLVAQWEREGVAVRVKKAGSLAEFPERLATGADALRYEGKNGVVVYQFPRDRFASEAAQFNNVAYVVTDGKPKLLRGAKTVFPEGWSSQKIVDSLIKVKQKPSAVDGNLIRGTEDGIEIMVRLGEDNRVLTAYPLVK